MERRRTQLCLHFPHCCRDDLLGCSGSQLSVESIGIASGFREVVIEGVTFVCESILDCNCMLHLSRNKYVKVHWKDSEVI